MRKLTREQVEEIVETAREKDERPDLREVDLREVDLSRVDLGEADVRKTQLARADLTGADLGRAKLLQANLLMADLSEANFFKADLTGAVLVRANLSEANFIAANLNGVNLIRAKLIRTNLSGADLGGVDLRMADLIRTNLGGANLKRADFSRANLTETDFSKALVQYTNFGDVDLSVAKGLDTVRHEGPSYVDVHTLQRSKGKIPERFLRGIGASDTFITSIPSLTNQPIQYYSCFISFSSKDSDFAERLHADLQDKGVRCWFAPEDLKIGAKIRPSIDQSIRVHDKLLLVLSEHSVASQWVEQEVETALNRERKQNELVLFPVRLDDAVMQSDAGWPALITNTRNIGDFSHWKEHDAYQKALNRLLRDLKVES